MALRIAVTADLHFDVARSRAPAEQVIARINDQKPDAVLLVGDTATADGGALEECLRRFDPAPAGRWFIPGNHELWTRRPPRDADDLIRNELPERITRAGWHWLPGAPVRIGRSAVVGSLGWYDYSFAESRLGLPTRFYQARLSPGAARALRRHDLNPDADDVPEQSRDFFARWNDGRFAQGIADDAAMLDQRMAELRADLAAVGESQQVLAAIHVSPLAELLPRVPGGAVPAQHRALAFTRAYLGSASIGEAILEFGNVSHILCGHTHVARESSLRGRPCINLGSTYTQKRMLLIELPD